MWYWYQTYGMIHSIFIFIFNKLISLLPDEATWSCGSTGWRCHEQCLQYLSQYSGGKSSHNINSSQHELTIITWAWLLVCIPHNNKTYMRKCQYKLSWQQQDIMTTTSNLVWAPSPWNNSYHSQLSSFVLLCLVTLVSGSKGMALQGLIAGFCENMTLGLLSGRSKYLKVLKI